MTLDELYCFVDDFCKIVLPELERNRLSNEKPRRNRKGRLSTSELMTIYLLFQSSGYRDFKHYYLQEILGGKLKSAFPQAVSYTRFVSLIPRIFMPLVLFLQSLFAPLDGLGYIDSTPIAVCNNKRTGSHKVFKHFAKLGKTTKGWFFGFKVHLICNARGELCAAHITAGNGDDRQPVDKMTLNMQGKLFGDKGYIDQKLADKLLQRGLQLITGTRKNMKSKLLTLVDKLLLRKRSLIESTNNQLKNVFHLEHTRHRNPFHGFANMTAAIIAYALHPNKPSLQLSQAEHELLTAA